MQMLFYPFEEKFHVPSLPIEFCDGKSIVSQMVGDETVEISRGKVFIDYHAKFLWVLLLGVFLSKSDNLITDNTCLLINKQENWLAHGIVHEQVEKIDLEIKKNERIFPSAQGIDFLGYVTFNGSYSLLRKRVKKKYARKLHKVKSRKRRRELIASFYGMAKHACCRNLFYKLTGKKMKSFKDLNVAYKPEDGKKRFAGAVVSIRELVNLPIVVKDFEVGVKTSQGEDRCVVSIEQNGEPKKFFTNSEEMKNILQQVSEMPDGFPFETTIKAETFGKGRTKYIFT